MTHNEKNTENMKSQLQCDPRRIIKKLQAYYHIQNLSIGFRTDVAKYLDPLVDQNPYDLEGYYFAADLDASLLEIIQRINDETESLISEIEKLEKENRYED